HLRSPQSSSRKPRIWVPTMRMSIRFMRAPSRRAGRGVRAFARKVLPAASPVLELALQQEHGHERVGRERLGERGDDDHRELDLRRGLRLAADRLHGAQTDAAQADARADGGDADTEGKTQRERGLQIHEWTSWFQWACC